MTPQEALNNAISKAGSHTALADHFGIAPAAITQWKKAGVPANRVLGLEELTGVSRHDLRPDVFGPRPTSRRRRAA